MRPLPFSKPFGGPQTPSRFVRDLQRECPSLSAGQILKIIRDRLAECRDNLQALNEEVRVKQLEFSWARHLYEDGSLRFAPSAVIDGALLAAAEGEESNSSPARTKTEEIGGSEKHGSETSIEKGSVGMATANPDESSPLSSVTTSSSSSSWGKSDGELQSSPCVGYRTRHRPPFTKSESEKDGNCNIIRAGDETPKRPCPSPLTPKKREAAPSLGSMMDRYFPDSPNQQKSERSDSVQVKLSAEDRLSERDLARRKLLRQKVADELGRKQTALKASRERFLADDTRMKEDAWMAARERVRWCEWDIMTLEYDIAYLLAHTRICRGPEPRGEVDVRSVKPPVRKPSSDSLVISRQDQIKPRAILTRREMEMARVEWEADPNFEALQVRIEGNRISKKASVKGQSR